MAKQKLHNKVTSTLQTTSPLECFNPPLLGERSALFTMLSSDTPCCTQPVDSVVKQFDEETKKMLALQYPEAVRPGGQRPSQNILSKPSRLVHNSLLYLFDLKTSMEVSAPTGDCWHWTDDQWKRWIESNSFNLSHDPFHLGQCWIYCGPTRNDGYVQTAIGVSHKGNKKPNRPLLHNVSYVLKNPQDAKLLAERFYLDPEVNVPLAQNKVPLENKSFKDLKLEVSHLCHISSCFNPWHLVLEPHSINEDRKGCKYGCPHRCPHNPKCLFDTRF
jgi:hypothetical protein